MAGARPEDVFGRVANAGVLSERSIVLIILTTAMERFIKWIKISMLREFTTQSSALTQPVWSLSSAT